MAVTPRDELEDGQAERDTANFEEHPQYAELDDGIKAAVSAKHFSWMPDVERQRFLASIGQPDVFPDS